MMEGNSPMQVGTYTRRKSLLSPARLLGYGVSPPKPNFLSKFTSVVVEPKKSEFSGTIRQKTLRTIKEMNESKQMNDTVQFPDIKGRNNKRSKEKSAKDKLKLERHKSYFSSQMENIAHGGSVPMAETGLFSHQKGVTVDLDESDEGPDIKIKAVKMK